MSLMDAIFTPSQANVWRWIFGSPERSFHLSELRRLTGLSSASLQREVNRLADAHLVSTQKVGNLRCFKANPDSPIFNELVSLTRKTLGVSSQLQKALLPHAEQLQWAGLFGSVAKSSDSANSDIDVMLVGDNLRLSDVFEWLAPAEAALGRKINPTCYSRSEFNARRHEEGTFVHQVLTQPLLTLTGDLNGPG
jgi:predicted nucleotidyltransferase